MGLRLYGIVPGNGRTPQLPSGVIVLSVRQLAAAVEPVPDEPEAAASAAPRHHEVVRILFSRDAVLPAPVGAVFRSEDVLRRWLDLHYVMLSHALTWVEGRMAARVHVSRRVAATDAGANTVAPIATDAAELARQLRGLSVASVDLQQNAESPVAAGFLVERDQWQGFVSQVARFGDGRADLRVAVTGPWPPYDFVRLRFTA